jgi:hypothetical protein
MLPRRYLAAAGLTFLVLCCTHILLFFLQLGAPFKAEYFVRDLLILKRSLAEPTESPKLVIVGDSNALFGFDSRTIEARLHIPVFNFGLHGGLPVEFLLNEAEPHLHAGDTVLLSLNYDYYQVESPYHEWYINQLITWGTDLFWERKWEEKLLIIQRTSLQRILAGHLVSLFGRNKPAVSRRHVLPADEVLARFKMQRNGETPPMYSYLNVNSHGDLIRIDGTSEFVSDYSLSTPLRDNPVLWQQLSSFYRTCRQRGVRVFVIWPAIADNPGLPLHLPALTAHLSAIIQHFNEIGMPVLGMPQEYVYARSYFADTRYHLTEQGRRQHTNQIIDLLLETRSFPTHTAAQNE